MPARAGTMVVLMAGQPGMGNHLYFLIAGEASGDVLGARLMRAMRVKVPQVHFVGIGGPMMQAEGLDLLFPHTELMHFGIFEVVRHIPRLLQRINQAAEAVVRMRPEAMITIDAPDFCFRVAQRVRRKAGNDIRLIHYVAPTVWAWREGRAKKIARFLDHLLVLLPFEPPYFTREGLDCTFVGHSVVEGGADKGNGEAFRAEHKIAANALLLAVLFGSRMAELQRLAPAFRDAVRLLHMKHPELTLVLPTVPHLRARVEAEIKTWNIPAVVIESEKDKFDAFAAANAALACSGTISLELALAGLPAVIAYKLNPLSVWLFRRFVKVRFANLVNIMHNREVVPEFLQDACTPQNLAQAVDTLLTDPQARREQLAHLSATAAWLGKGAFVPSEKAAEAVLKVAGERIPTVLQVVPALVTGGVERGTVEVSDALVKAGFRSLVASSGGPMVPEIEAKGGRHITLPMKSKNPFTMIANIRRLCRVISANKVDIVHVRSRAPAWSAYFACRISNVPFMSTFHNAYVAQNALKHFYNSVMAKGVRVIAISNFVADCAEHLYGVHREIMCVVPRGVDIDAFDPEKENTAKIEALRDAWHLPSGKPVILMPGRLTRWKGQLVLIEALKIIAERDFHCVIVGRGKDNRYKAELLDKIHDLGLEEKVSVVDVCRDMPSAYRLADAVVVPSIRPEGFGRVAIEAQAMGTPVIASDLGAAKETIIQGVTGFLVPSSNPAALAKALGNVLNMPPDARRIWADRAIRRIRDQFTTANMTFKTIEVYRDLLLHKRTE